MVQPAVINSAAATAESSRLQAERYKPLAEANAVSKQDYDNAVASHLQAQAAVETAHINLAIRHGGTVVIMEKFDPEQYLRLVERYQVTHSQLVPTMFSRMLKLPAEARKRRAQQSR